MTTYVTVIIGAYNAMPYITQTLRSVLKQTMDRDRIQLIAVDDVSTDGTYEELLRFRDEEWPEMIVDRLDRNSGGPSAPRNRGLQYAEGTWLFFLDADDYLGTEALERMTAFGEEHDTEIVLGRMGSAGGRGVPQSMYKETVARVDLFDSRIYWTLNVMKLFKHDLFTRTGLVFPEDVFYAEDQPAITIAYLEARGISVLADYDYVYWRIRDDGGNITAVTPIDKYMVALERTIEILCEYLEPGKNRDWLMRRHFQLGLHNCIRQLAKGDPRHDAFRADTMEKIRGITIEHYREAMSDILIPVKRMTYELVKRGRFDELAQIYAWDTEERHKGPWFIEDGVAYEEWPFFRDPELALPDYCYDVTRWVKPNRYLASASWKGETLEIAGRGYLHRIPSLQVTTEVLVRLRDEDAEAPLEYVVPMTPDPAYDPGPDEIDAERDVADHAGSGFVAHIDPTTLADGKPLGWGLWDVYLRFSSGGLVREARLGSERDEAIDTTIRHRFVGEGESLRLAAAYYTKPYGNLTLDIGSAKHKLSIAVESAQWDSQQPATVIVTGSVAATRVPTDAVYVRLEGPEGTVFEVPTSLTELAHETRLECSIPLKQAADGRALPDGTWKATVRIDAGGASGTGRIPDDEPLPTIRWWRGLRPMHARSLGKPAASLRLRITPVNLRHAIKRRLGL